MDHEPKNFQTRLLRVSDLCKKLGISRAQIYRLLSAGDFPKPLRLSERARAWRESDIELWIDEREVAA